MDREPLSAFGSHIIEAAKLGPTVFPIVFAAIIGRLMKSVALWRAQHGTNLGFLEQLVGSQNIAGAIERMFMLRRFGVLSFAIVLVWALSPLGGQSSLRILEITDSTTKTSQNVYYFDMNNGKSVFDGADDLDHSAFAISALYTASLLASEDVKTSPLDQWSNIKVPMLEALSPATEPLSGNPWINATEIADRNYSSLIGLMLANVPSQGTTNFSMESSYFNVDCSSGVLILFSDNENYTVAEQTLNSTLNNRITLHNSSDLWGGLYTNGRNSFFVDTADYSAANGSDTKEYVNILYGSNLGSTSSSDVWLSNCTLATARVESNVLCSGPKCHVDRMRRSEKDTRPAYALNFDSIVFRNMLLWFPDAAGATADGVISPTDLYLQGYNSPLTLAGTNAGDYSDVTAEMFSKRLSVLLNTLYQASISPSYTARGASTNLTAYEISTNYTAYWKELPDVFLANVTEATISDLVPVYHADRLWIGLLLVVTFTLQILAAVGMVLKYTATAPDILGHVSTLTRDNPFTEVPEGGNTLSGLERARLLRDIKVQIGDVNWEEERGHVAFRSVINAREFKQGHVSRSKVYF